MPGICAAVKATTCVLGVVSEDDVEVVEVASACAHDDDAAHLYSSAALDEPVPLASTQPLDLLQRPLCFGREQVCEALLRAQPLLDRRFSRRPVRQPPLALLDLVQRPEAALDRAVDDRGRDACLVAPAERAVGQHVQEGGPVGLPRLGGLEAQVLPVWAGRRLRDVRDPVCGCDRGQVLSLLHLAERADAGRAGRRRRAEGRCAGALDARCSCTPRCRSRRRRTGGRARAPRTAPAGRCRTCRRRRRRRRSSVRPPVAARLGGGAPGMRLSTPLAPAAAFSKATCSQGTFQAVVG